MFSEIYPSCGTNDFASKLPDYPWQKVGADLFELEGIKYLLLADCFSHYIEIVKLTSTTEPQFVSREMKMFSASYGFVHVTSSPHYPQGNGQAERAVQTTKQLLSSGADPALRPGINTEKDEHQEAEHQPSLDANQDVIPELPAPVPVP
ncbi:hypothetical protein EMCRGX_G004190 [Ephydatia muelleri]